MSDQIQSTFFEGLAFLTIGVTFYLLAVALKNDRLRMQHPILSKRATKLALTALFVSSFGRLTLPEHSTLWVMVFQFFVLFTLMQMAFYYRKMYARVRIEFVDHTAYLTIPTDKYVEVEKGVWLRVLKPGFEVLVPSEIDLQKIMDEYNQDEWVAIAFKIKDDSEFPEHIHPKWEHTYLVEGEATIFENYRKLIPGKHIEVPPITKHIFRAESYCMGVSFIQK